ncbi:MAG: DNA/RNA nuclease SfsA [Oscillospiraceae bacterium]|nr:DNA/RNA nuclease SfsA [Oscillospiraceae bacterium]
MILYKNMVPGTFCARPNRFIAHVQIAGKEEICHVKNTGRCKELLVPGAQVWCQHHDDPNRKTKWSLIAVQKGERLINMDSQIPNKVAYDYVNQGGLGFVPEFVKGEKTYGTSRFDLYYEAQGKKGFVEVKGVTLEQDGIARFPDAPTERGRKHLLELQKAASEGYEAWVLFVIQMSDIRHFEPNSATDPAFAEALRQVAQNGVRIRAAECAVTPNGLVITKEVPVQFL